MIRVLSGDVSGFQRPYSSTGIVNFYHCIGADMRQIRQENVRQGAHSAHGESSFYHASVDGTLYRYSGYGKICSVDEPTVQSCTLSGGLIVYEFSFPGVPPVWPAAGPPPASMPYTKWGFQCTQYTSMSNKQCLINCGWYIAANPKQYKYQYFSLNSIWWYPHHAVTPDEIVQHVLSSTSSSSWVDWSRRTTMSMERLHLLPCPVIPDFIGYTEFRRILDDSSTIKRDRRYLLSDLAQDVAERSCDLDINSIAYAKEFLESIVNIYKIAQGDLNSLVGSDLLKGITDKRVVKTMADAELSASYGLKLTISDTRKLLRSFERQLQSYKYGIARSSGTLDYSRSGVSYHEQHFYKVWYQRSCAGFQGLLNDLFNKDAFLTLQNVWDLIPYSFVIDWALPIEQFLNQQDATTRLSVLPISEVVHTTKITVSYSDSAVQQLTAGLSGQIGVTLYKRDANASLPPIYPHFQGRDQFQSWTQAAALITQKILK